MASVGAEPVGKEVIRKFLFTHLLDAKYGRKAIWKRIRKAEGRNIIRVRRAEQSGEDLQFVGFAALLLPLSQMITRS